MSEMLGASLFDTSLCHVDRRVLVGTPLVSGAFHLAGACKRSAYTITMVGFFTDASLDPAGAPPPPPRARRLLIATCAVCLAARGGVSYMGDLIGGVGDCVNNGCVLVLVLSQTMCSTW